MKKIMLVYPPVGSYQRGEDRCQINIDASVANAFRACNDLGYVASILKEKYQIFLKDYSAEKLSYINFENDFISFSPDIIFISTTNGSIYEDLAFVAKVKKLKKEIIVVLKGALFFNPEPQLFDELDLSNVDYLIGGEVEFIIADLLQGSNLELIQGISYKKDGNWVSNNMVEFNFELDSIPFPARELMNNSLYVNPATNRPMATISTSRGCPSSCIYCISPIISGKNVRYRTPENVVQELKECVHKHNICDFFFKSDTFTINKDWVIQLCDLIINSELKGKINWVANSRVNTIDEEMLLKMKQAGCSVIALGIESGSDESLVKMKKGTNVEQNRKAVKLIKNFGLKTYGFYLIGFPWESKQHLEQTRNLIFELDTDFIELSITTPFKGCELYSMLCEKLDDGAKVLGKDSFKYITLGTDHLTSEEIQTFRKNIILKYHLRPKYILKKIFNKDLTPSLFFNYVKYGFRLLKNIFNL